MSHALRADADTVDVLAPDAAELARRWWHWQRETAAMSPLVRRRNPRVAAGLEKVTSRDYCLGDSYSRLDWNAVARLDELFVWNNPGREIWRHAVWVDLNPRMELFDEKVRWAMNAAEIFATWSALAGETVLTPVTENATLFWHAIRQQLPTHETVAYGRQDCDVKTAVRSLGRLSPPADAITLISDWLDPADLQLAIHTLAPRGVQLDIIQVLSPQERNPSHRGAVKLVDPATGRHIRTRLTKSDVAAYQEELAIYQRKLAAEVAAAGGRFLTLTCRGSIGDLLEKLSQTLGHCGKFPVATGAAG